MHQTNETLRKILHIAFGLCAFLLRWLAWPVAAAIAAAAVIGNWLVLHRLTGRTVSRHERGYDAGIVLYPAVVLALIVIFRNRIEIAGTVWAILAFGDGFATLAGRAIGGPRLRWNGAKTWSGLVAFAAFGFVGAETVYFWLRTAPIALQPLLVIALVVAISAIVESLPLGLDDNLTVPLAAALTMTTLVHSSGSFLVHAEWVWLAVNTVLAVAGSLAGAVDRSGAIGGWVIGTILILFGGSALYLVLVAFFVIGTAATKLGYARKSALGVAQEKGGRRGAAHAVANVGVSAMLAVAAATVVEHATLLWFAAAAALVTATADTAASEIGQLVGRRAVLPLTLRRVPPGTEGAMSLEGTVAGLLAAAVVAAVASWGRLGIVDATLVGQMTAAAFAGSTLESIAGSWNRKQKNPVPNGVLNFFNTLAGAAVFLMLARR